MHYCELDIIHSSFNMKAIKLKSWIMFFIVCYGYFFFKTQKRDGNAFYSTSSPGQITQDYEIIYTDRKDVMKERRHRVEEICKTIRRVTNKTEEVSGISSLNMSYCVVPKAGCTFWIRIIKYMAGNNLSGNPMTQTKYQVHNTEKDLLKTLETNAESITFLANSLRIMTVREPYSRLWSAYIDKFVLLDFWKSKGRHIVRMTRINPHRNSLMCGHDVTFPEYIQYVIRIGNNISYWNQDKHWLPASYICDPCVFKPDIIGKQETFLADLVYSLRQINLESIIKQIASVDQTEFEIKDEIDYNLNIFQRVKHCISFDQLFERMWYAFTLNGYIPANTPFHRTLSGNSFYASIKSTMLEYNITRSRIKELRKESMTKAFQQLPKEHIRQLKSLFYYDFELFDYRVNPEF